ncbi:putative NAD/NADP octopine/nopaline dehydrogenase [Nemania sp. FL0916]|nr:putative NAD/NADP octopine/nopaline dehydrogenase [Nemania sp. FL0916]
MITSVTIIGIGNSGCAFAVDLENRGIKTLLYAHPNHSANAAVIRSHGYLDSMGEIAGRFYPVVSTHMREALAFSKIVIIAVPSYAQADILSELEKHDVSKHVLIAASGNFFTLIACRRLRARFLLETSASPFGSRLLDGKPTEQDLSQSKCGMMIHVLGCKSTMPIASLPTDLPGDLRADVERVFPAPLQWCSNVVEAAFYNFNGVLHPVTAVMNAGWVEHSKGDFYFYKQGMTPAVAKIMQQIDNERIAIAEHFGPATTCLKQMNAYYGEECASLSEFAGKSKLHGSMKLCPTNMQHRYIVEDLPYVLVPWYELGVKAGLESPVMRSLILWSSVINGADYLKIGRNIAALGLENWSLDEILGMVMAKSDTLDAELSRYVDRKCTFV